MTENEKSVCIGLWRQGNKTETIMWILGHPYVTIDKCINEYLKTLQVK